MPSQPHDFVIVIPVADRPRHLAECLTSLQALCRQYPYAGELSVLVVDDSREADSIGRHRQLAQDFSCEGLPTQHLDQDAQRALVEGLPPALRARLAGVLGEGTAYAHKGASITRNIAYLWLARLQRDGRRRLFWFIDSDQEFRVNVATPAGESPVYALDYFHALDRLFHATPTQVLTGKVVGDPPVSPAVMAGNFLDDVLGFLADVADLDAAAACTLHGEAARPVSDAAYHDMAELFGFKPDEAAYRYRCPLHRAHDHAACFADFAGRVARFFDGEHPTRRSVYQPEAVGIQPARTIYTGNYVFTPALLDRFIPFAALKLRMAGPTLGRILRAELAERFVSANLPMLHKRTVEAIGQSEFRPGIERQNQRVDLSGEFERQYFGDVMLFAMATLVDQGYPGTALPAAAIAETVAATEAGMQEKYRAKHAEVAARIERLEAVFTAPGQWWQGVPGLAAARADLRHFIDNMRDNFGAAAAVWRLLGDADHRQWRKAEICAAIGRYPDERAAWRAALDSV